MVKGVGLRVEGVGFRVQGSECRVQGVGFRVYRVTSLIRNTPPPKITAGP